MISWKGNAQCLVYVMVVRNLQLLQRVEFLKLVQLQTKFMHWNLRKELVYNFCIVSCWKHTCKNRRGDNKAQKTNIDQRMVSHYFKFLSTGQTFRIISYQYGLSPSSVSRIVPNVSETIIKALAGEYMCYPSNEEEQRKIAREFEKKVAISALSWCD